MPKTLIVVVSALCLAVFSDQILAPRTVWTYTRYEHQLVKMDGAKLTSWRSRWEKNIITARDRYCEQELGEDMGWLMFPFLKGYYFGYKATGDPGWVRLLVACTDAWVNRAVKEPDGYLGWPKVGAAGTDIDHLDSFYADSLLGEALILRYVDLMSQEILMTPVLKQEFGTKAQSYIEMSEQVFDKWDRRGVWRETENGGMISVVLPVGIDRKTGKWTDSYEKMNASLSGFSHQNNKANLVATWLLAMFDATQRPIYKQRAEKWFQLMKSRMKLQDDGTYKIWNYWEPAGPWDYRFHLIPKHWIGVHPNNGYYDVDVEAIITAYEHDLVFSQDNISRLIATALANKRYWTALVPYNNTIQMEFEDHNDPDSWSGLSATPWYLALQADAYMPRR